MIVETDRHGRKNAKGLALLQLCPGGVPSSVFFVVERNAYGLESQTLAESVEHMEYFIGEHTCPTNEVPVEAIIDLAAENRYPEDPHGVLKFVAWRPLPNDYAGKCPPGGWRTLFPEIPA